MRNFAFPLILVFAALAAQVAVADERLPDGDTARAAQGGLRAAWYSAPTTRYDHAVLGDGLEAGALSVKTAQGSVLTHTLADSQVFEDITPRLADLDGDGTAEVITILTSVTKGASLAVFGLSGSDTALRLRAKTGFIGQTHRWLNVAGVADYNGDGQLDVALVLTPHLGGALQIWTLRDEGLVLIGALDGFSNHVIGTRDLGLSATIQGQGAQNPQLLVPSADRSTLRLVAFKDGTLREVARFALRAKVAGAFQPKADGRVTVPLSGGGRQTITLTP